MIERKLFEINIKSVFFREEIPIKDRLRHRAQIGPLSNVRNDYYFFHTGKFLDDTPDPSDGIMTLATIEIAVRCDQDLGADLAEPIQNTFDSEIR